MCISSVFADKFNGKGLISGWDFTPLQVSILSMDKSKLDAQLFDEKTHTLGTFGLVGIQQSSAVISAAPFNELQNNYGVQVALILAQGSNNYGFSFGFATSWQKSYGVQIGILNNTENIFSGGDRLSLVGINIADFIQIGMINANIPIQCGLINGQTDGYFQLGALNCGEKNLFQLGLLNAGVNSHIQIALVNGGKKVNCQIGLYNVQDNGVQIGLLNISPGTDKFAENTSFQIGLLNYNPNALIPWLPLFNFSFDNKSKK